MRLAPRRPAPSGARVLQCTGCSRVASVPDWCGRPICVHAWMSNVPEIWDADDVDGEGRTIEESPSVDYRTPGKRWSPMREVKVR